MSRFGLCVAKCLGHSRILLILLSVTYAIGVATFAAAEPKQPKWYVPAANAETAAGGCAHLCAPYGGVQQSGPEKPNPYNLCVRMSYCMCNAPLIAGTWVSAHCLSGQTALEKNASSLN